MQTREFVKVFVYEDGELESNPLRAFSQRQQRSKVSDDGSSVIRPFQKNLSALAKQTVDMQKTICLLIKPGQRPG